MNSGDAFWLGSFVATLFWGWTLIWYRLGKAYGTPIGPFR